MVKSIVLLALSCASAVSAHGYIERVTVNGQNYNGYNPAISPWQPDQVGAITMAPNNFNDSYGVTTAD